MTPEIKKRISQINSGIVLEGYKKTKCGIVPVDWEILKLADIIHIEQRPVKKPIQPYVRIGIRSHAKGTFQELVENPASINMDILYVVKKDDLIVNITFAWEHAIALANDNDENKLVSHRFPTYVFDNDSPMYYKYVFFQDVFRQRLELISPGGAGRNRVLNKIDFLNLEIYHPPLAEQQKIAEILSAQDKLIELLERKTEQLKKLKKGYLQKMFPKNGESVPEIRFRGFTDDWKQYRLGDMGKTFTGLSGKTKEDFGHGDGKFITYMNVFLNPISDPKKTEVIEIDNSQNAVQYGDVFFTTSSETPDEVGMSSVWLENADNIYLNSFCFGYRPTGEIDSHYMAYMLRSEIIRKKSYIWHREFQDIIFQKML